MKLFQQLLVAPAALGLLAPVVAQAADLNLNGVNQYAASSQDQVTSITQFSDVRPTDWAYQALSNLISRYGCVAGYPNGTFKGGQAMTRYEAAALLNACLDRISDTTDELKRLVAEFSKELAVLRGRVDGLEAKVGELQATQFSTTTKLKGLATMVLGASTYSSNNYGGATGGFNSNIGFPVPQNTSLPNGLTFNYDVRLNFDTSFTGKDLLRTTLRAGNAGQSAFGFNNAVTTATALETFFQDPTIPGGTANNIVGINRLFYQFPLGKSFTATVGARVRQDDMLAMWPSVYPADTVLDMFTYAGSPVTYALNLGGGAGLWWRNGGFSVSANYVSANAGNGSPSQTNAATGNFGTNSGGVGTSASASSTTVQVGYAGNNYGLAAAYAYNQNLLYQATNTVNAGIGNNLAGGGLNSTNSFALSGYWQPSHNGWIPSLSAGWGIGTSQNLAGNGTAIASGAVLNSWTLGLQWADAFVKGNALGMGLGQNTMVSKSMYGGGTPNDGNWAWEWWYKFQVTDNISVTPALYYLSRPMGGLTPATGSTGGNGYFSSFGGLIKTTFKF